MFRKDKKYWLWSAWATREETINFLIKKVAELEKSLSTFPEKEKRHNNDLTKICFNYACEDLDKSKDRCKRDKVCDMQIRKSSLES